MNRRNAASAWHRIPTPDLCSCCRRCFARVRVTPVGPDVSGPPSPAPGSTIDTENSCPPAQQDCLEEDQQYESLHLAPGVSKLALVACFAMCGQQALLLQTTSWASRGLVLLPLGVVSGFLYGLILAEASALTRKMQTAYITAAVCSSGYLLCNLAARPKLGSPVWGALVLLTMLVHLPWARNRKLGCCVCLWCVLLPGLLRLASHHFDLVLQIPVSGRGILVAALATLWETLGLCSLTLAWTRFSSTDVDRRLYFTLAAVMVQAAEQWKLVAFLGSALRNGQDLSDWGQICTMLGGYGFVSVLLDVAGRSVCLPALLATAFGIAFTISAEMDAVLRCKFTFSYTPFMVLVFSLPVSAAAGKTWIGREVALLLMIALLQELFSDALLVLLYCLKRRDCFWNQLKALQQPGGHCILAPQIFGFHDIYTADPRSEGGDSGRPAPQSGGDASEGGLGGHAQWLVIIYVWIFVLVSTSMVGMLGSCSYNMADVLCAN